MPWMSSTRFAIQHQRSFARHRRMIRHVCVRHIRRAQVGVQPIGAAGILHPVQRHLQAFLAIASTWPVSAETDPYSCALPLAGS